MKRYLDNLYVDAITAMLMIAMVATGYILRFPLPPGSNKSLNLWGLTRHQWGTVHSWISLGLLVLVILHVALHWRWVVVSFNRRIMGTTSPSKSSLASGLLTLAVISAVLAIFGWAALTGVKAITKPIEGVCSPENNSDQAGTVASVDEIPATHQRVAFWNDVYPIFEKYCLHCHGPSKQVSGFRVDRRKDFFEGKTPFIVPGNSKGSSLIDILSGERKDMARADVHHLTDNQVSVVKAWIDAGADWPEHPAE